MERRPDLKIIIPTYGRQGNQKTYACLPPKYQNLVHFIVRDEEYGFFSKSYPQNKIHRLPKAVENIANTRQWIRDKFTNDRVIVFDDNLKYIRKVVEQDGKWLRIDLTEVDFDNLVTRIHDHLDTYVHGALVFDKSIGPNQYGTTHYINGRVITNIFADFSRWPKDVKYDDDPRFCCGSDTYITLALISRGFANVIITNYCVSKTYREQGGCNTYRTIEKHNTSCEALKELFPQFVTLKSGVIKQGIWKGQVMLTTICHWKKAYKACTLKV